MISSRDQYVSAAKVADVATAGRLVVQLNGHVIALFAHAGRIYAVDNRCPHMGFPLHRGTLKDGILTCHWHHARFDLASGGTFDQFADDVRIFPVQIRDGEVWVDLTPPVDPHLHQRDRLRDGLERDIPLVIAKAVLTLVDATDGHEAPVRMGLEYGARYRQAGWGQGLTILTCMSNVLPHLEGDDRARALYHGLSAVARECAGAPPRFELRPLPTTTTDFPTLVRWFRQFIEVRDAEGAERCVVSAIRSGADATHMAEMLFAAATDHRYIDIGHPLDFTNKAFEALETVGWSLAELVLTSLTTSYANADRMEESNEWRNPVDLVALEETAFEQLPGALEAGRNRRGPWAGRESLISVLLGEDPQAIADALLAALHEGCPEVDLAAIVAYGAALRLARFHTSNEFSDWDTALHTFTFANAVQQGLRRTPSPALLRGVFDGAMSIYLDRFLNIPPAPTPELTRQSANPDELLGELRVLLDRQQQVNEAGTLVFHYLSAGGDPRRLLTTLGSLMIREDRNFHTIQVIEAAFRQFSLLRGTPEGVQTMVAAARYLGAHAPTMRAQGQTFHIASRLHRGDRLYA